jgi:hypothetical protein
MTFNSENAGVARGLLRPIKAQSPAPRFAAVEEIENRAAALSQRLAEVVVLVEDFGDALLGTHNEDLPEFATRPLHAGGALGAIEELIGAADQALHTLEARLGRVLGILPGRGNSLPRREP